MTTTNDTTKRIQELNDQFRRALGGSGSGRKFMTAGVAALPIDDQAAILVKVVSFADFTPDSDPYEEHDFGAFDHNGQNCFGRSIVTIKRLTSTPMPRPARRI